MDTQVSIKGVSDGFLVLIDDSLKEFEIENEVLKKLERISHLLKGANLYIDSTEKEKISSMLNHTLQKKFLINEVIPFVMPSLEKKDKSNQKTKAAPQPKTPESPWQTHESSSLIISGRVRSGQKIDAKKHLIIMGDVNPGAEVIAGGDIIVVGTLSGTAIAGQNRDDSSIIFAMNFKPTQIQINDIIGLGGEKKNNPVSEIAYLNEDRELVIKNYMEESPFAKLPWPKAR